MNFKADSDFSIIISDLIEKNNLKCNLISGQIEYNENIEKLVNQTWDLYQSRLDLFDGEVFGLIDYIYDENILSYTVQKTSYKYFFGTNSINSDLFENKEIMANTLAVCIVVETSDNCIALGLRNSKMGEFPSFWHVPGGNMEFLLPNPAYNTALKELSEEIGVKEKHLENFICTGLAKNNLNHKPEFLFYAKLKIKSHELLELIKTAPDKNEHISLNLIKKHDIKKFLGTHKVAPIGKATFASKPIPREFIK